jgi:hypothetical protein
MRAPWLLAGVAIGVVAASAVHAQVFVPPRAAPSIGDWSAGGVEVCPDIDWARRQPAVASDGQGGVYVVWQDWRDRTAANLYSQRFGPQGQMLWQASARPISQQTGDEAMPQALADASGGLFVAWMDFRDPVGRVYVQHLMASGAIIPGWVADGIPLAAGTQQTSFAMIPDGAGGAIFATLEIRGGVQGVYAYRLAANGAPGPGWPATGLALTSDASVNYEPPSLTSDGAGGAIIAWSLRGSFCGPTCDPPHALAVARVADAHVQWAFVDSSASFAPLLAGDGAGGALALAPTPDAFLTEARVAATGGLTWSVDLLSQHSAGFSRAISSDGAGGAYLAWEDARTGDHDLYALHVDADGSLAPGWAADGLPLCTVPGRQQRPVLLTTPQRYLFAVWEDERLGDRDLYCTLRSADGTFGPALNGAWGPQGNVFAQFPGDQQLAVVTPDVSSAMFVAWQDSRDGRDKVYVQHVTLDFPTAVAVSLVSSEATPDVVRLRWRMEGGAGLRADVQRREASGDWLTLASLQPDGVGDIAFEDRAVTPGASYEYRLRWSEDETEHVAGDVRVVVPRSAALALSPPEPNPSAGAFRVRFALAGGAPARLEVLDVAGRRIAVRELSAGAGSHVEEFAAAATWPAGLYLVRLSEGGRARVTRLAIAR